MFRLILLIPLIFAMSVFLIGCSSEEPQVQAPPRAVTFMKLEELNPQRLTRLTGSVESWKREMLSFRVGGRIADVLEAGVDIKGRIVDKSDKVLSEGTVLAKLDVDRYLLQRDEAAARVEVTKARAQQAKTELERTIPERIKSATADLKRKQSEYDRQKDLFDQKATSQAALEQAENEFRQAEATLAQAQAEQATKEAELAALNARVVETEQLLKQAEVDLDDCRLFSPFSGQISKVHAIAGSNLEKGMPVVTVQMMDPVKVEIAVSQETDREVRFNEIVDVFIDNSDFSIPGLVYLKDTVADAATRTFAITILVRNRRVEIGLPDEYRGKKLPRTGGLFTLESEKPDGKPPYYAERRSIHTDADGKAFVWKVVGMTTEDLRGQFDPIFTVKKVPVTVGEKVLPLLRLYEFVELMDIGSLSPKKSLLTGRLPKGVKDGDKVFLSRREWLLRPGQLVQVQLKKRAPTPGFYLPRPAILQVDGKNYVFAVDETTATEEKARRVEVRLEDSIGDYRRIVPVEENALSSGTKVVLDGVHYLRDGDRINAFDEIEAPL